MKYCLFQPSLHYILIYILEEGLYIVNALQPGVFWDADFSIFQHGCQLISIGHVSLIKSGMVFQHGFAKAINSHETAVVFCRVCHCSYPFLKSTCYDKLGLNLTITQTHDIKRKMLTFPLIDTSRYPSDHFR